MAHYAIGDIQGCHAELCQLLDVVGFSPARDRLWLVGDLVNRGPGSLAVLREVMALGDAVVAVLGNHDFHLLTVAAGHRKPHREDTLDAILAAPDRDALVAWLAARPLVVAEGDLVMVHAGFLPAWTVAQALLLSHEVQAMLASDRAHAFLGALYGDEPRTWSDDLEGFARLRAVVNACTRLRFCTADGTMEFREKRGPGHVPEGYLPWYAHAHRRSAGATVVCGHWSTLELLLAPNVLMLDSGCLWGGTLTAVRLPDRRVFQVPSRSKVQPKPFG
ncbi:MAG: symmetrical bis(5'-nucleosyl)-tetraphosphatase [Betaproteobacteria bacterium]|nr:symmetrical bis(5'-nucleosyl)-tetraphosphatase [Betaproteobacteria bacterium]MCC7218352.1 symmetrical bis(5'-nucleosyl)-tetraphosphatase [Burkholderiales bacterium]